MLEKVSIYTDGACSGNPGPGGYAYIIVSGEKIIYEFSSSVPDTTNNRMELMAVIEALQHSPAGEITLFSDSRYVVDAINKGWVYAWEKDNWAKRKNKDLWMAFLQQNRNKKVTYVWVEGHKDNVFNNKCDTLARQAIIKIKNNV